MVLAGMKLLPESGRPLNILGFSRWLMAISCILSFTAITALAQTSTSKVRIRNLGPFQPTKSDVVSTFRMELEPTTEIGDIRLIHNGEEIAVDYKEFNYDGVRFLDLFPKEPLSELDDGEHEVIVNLAPKGESARTSPRRLSVSKTYTIDREDPEVSVSLSPTGQIKVDVHDQNIDHSRLVLSYMNNSGEYAQKVLKGFEKRAENQAQFLIDATQLDINAETLVIGVQDGASNEQRAVLPGRSMAQTRQVLLQTQTASTPTSIESSVTNSSSVGALTQTQYNDCSKMKLKVVIPYWPNESTDIHKEDETEFREQIFIKTKRELGGRGLGDPTMLEISDSAIYLDASKFVDFKKKTDPSGTYQGVEWRYSSLSMKLANTLLAMLPEVPVLLISGYDGGPEQVWGQAIPGYGFISINMFDDPPSLDWRAVTLGHEIGHLLGLGHRGFTIMDTWGTFFLDSDQRVAVLAHACTPDFDPPHNYYRSNFFSAFGAWFNPFSTAAAPDNSLCGNFELDEGEACESNITPMAHNGWMAYSTAIGWHPDFAVFDVDSNHYSVASFAWNLEDIYTIGVRVPLISKRDSKFDVCSGAHFLEGVRYDLLPGTEPCTVVEVSRPELNCWDAARGDIEAYLACPKRTKLPVLEKLVAGTFNELWAIQDVCNSWNCPMFMPLEFWNSFGAGHSGFLNLFRWNGVFQLVWQMISDADFLYLIEMMRNGDGDPSSSCGGEDRAMCGTGSCDAGKECTWIPPRSNTIDGFGWWVPGHCGCRPPKPPEPPEPGPFTPIDGSQHPELEIIAGSHQSLAGDSIGF